MKARKVIFIPVLLHTVLMLLFCGCANVLPIDTEDISATRNSEETATAMPTEAPNESESDAVTEPTFTNDYAEACEAYRKFLLGHSKSDINETIYRYCGWPENADFKLVDVNADGIPELHFRGGRVYTMFSYGDGGIFTVTSCPREAELMNNLAVYYNYWPMNHSAASTQGYFELDENLEKQFSIFFDYDDRGEISFYRIAYNDDQYDKQLRVSKDEFEEIVNPYLEYCTNPANYDLISWTNYGEWLLQHEDERAPDDYILPHE